MKIQLMPEADKSLAKITQRGVTALCEAKETFAFLKELELSVTHSPSKMWAAAKNDKSRIRSPSKLRDGKPILRLDPDHLHCIALIVEEDDEIFVLDFCSQADLTAAEDRLIDEF